MSLDPPNPPPPFAPPVSSYGGPVAELIAQQMLSPPTRPGLLATLNQFEIQRVLGSGGMGIVLLARDANTGRSVAVKLIRPELVSDQQILHRFVKEAGHLQRLKHPNIVPVLEISDRAAGPYFVMPYFEQGSLAQCIQPGQPLDAVFILDMAWRIAGGLRFAHQRGIIHRDLKPANILRAGDDQACLADFGLARTLFNDTIVDVEREQVEGTAAYMSPGVAAGNAEDTRCDIYAFGALLYEMLTGEPPYAGAAIKEIRRQILAGPPRPIKERNPRADDGLVAVVEGAMARELRDRYADMADVVADLERIREGKTPAGPHGLARGGLRQVRRVPGVAWVATGMAAAAVIGWIFVWRPAPKTNAPLVPVAPAINPTPGANAEPHWTSTVFAGQTGGGGSTDGPGAAARFLAPGGIALDSVGNLYVADTGNNTIRKISPAGSVTTLAGKPGSHGSTDGAGNAARFFAPFGIAVDRFGNLFVAEVANNIIRRITPDGRARTLAGLPTIPGANDGIAEKAQFRNPWNVAVDRTGTVFVADTSNFAIRRITPNGSVSTLAGRAGSPGYADGAGSQARFRDPHGVALDSAGNVYVADTGNDVIRKITSAGVVTTIAGQAGSPGEADGASGAARLRSPQSLTVDIAGYIYIADTDNLSIRILTPKGALTTLAVTGDLGHPDAIAVDASGNIYVADTMNDVIRKIALSVGSGNK